MINQTWQSHFWARDGDYSRCGDARTDCFLPFYLLFPLLFSVSLFFLIRSPVRANFDPGNDARVEIAFLIVRPGS